ncbi:hypothetical protein A2856_02480 [Candidatus Uhrbacteria bacterium RIFCSPHIGHO2_01_FULL_63_20]|uniref:Transposase IS200-like domain-containing protein n=1 Tax=Candidatus Uhrbacteria bacterium RIFCSPHIGHO2_01_FULL_63_20 TaxID=1802385 RepID=A0A1F7TKJ0_9BACT|nr:MAG: hypothetical protein A2856_02480 [Candidatus Uhrbacteria bacterium RIFCSPHIGHO2_01_FULL_63_20]
MREPFDTESYYHVYNRGVDKRTIFCGEQDFRRFYESMYLFNDQTYFHAGGNSIEKDIRLSAHEVLSDDRKPLVRIVAYCLMRNHFHLLLQQCVEEGISKFLHRVGMGYAKYFNLKYDRTGSLFESQFNAKPAQSEAHFQWLPRYIHMNALDGTEIAWRDDGKLDWTRGHAVLDAYPWSSHHFYSTDEQELPLVDEKIVRTWFPTGEVYRRYLELSPSPGDGEDQWNQAIPVTK